MANYLIGLDISHWQPPLNWTKIFNAGVRFVFAKATDVNTKTGKDVQDAGFLEHVASAKKAGILTGAYHFIHPKYPASQQVNNFVTQFNKATPDLPPVIDLENFDNQPNNKVHDLVLAYAEGIKTKLGKYPIIYSRDGLIANANLKSYVSNSNLYWKAQYQNKPSGIPCSFWQFSESFRIPGVAVNLDGDYFLGTMESLLSLCNSPVPVPAPIPVPVEKTGIVEASILNIRSGPGIEFRVIGHLHKGDQILIEDIENMRWAKIADGYCAISGAGGIFVEVRQ